MPSARVSRPYAWNATEHPQTVLAMNADRSRSVRVRVVSSAITLDRMPWWVPAGTLALGRSCCESPS
jgi:hypothetical protein